MCGICGIIDYKKNAEIHKSLVNRMCNVMRHRGPDDQGIYHKDNVVIGHRRLSIIDLSSGHQPMLSDDKTKSIVFNGEIYNFPEIKKALQSAGINFNTSSDTEVLLKGYEHYGTKILDHLNGMFAFAIWDASKKKLFAARDRLGKKPFYFYKGSDRFVFASEIKAILQDNSVIRQVDEEALDKFFSYGYIPSPYSIFEKIYKLRPGHYLTWEDKNIELKQYWDVEYTPDEGALSEQDYVDKLHEILENAVRRRLISDVPLGAFLSGGLDSSVVVALMAEIMNEPVQTFTIGFNEKIYSEIDDARIVSKACNTNHREFVVQPDAIEILPKLIQHFDEPFADSSAIPTYYVSKMARQHVTVILSGDGGDEMFAGYRSYYRRNQYEHFKRIPKFVRQRIIGPFASSLPIETKGRNLLLEISQLEKKEQFEIIELYPQIKNDIYHEQFRQALTQYEPAFSPVKYWKNLPVDPKLSRMQYVDTKIYLPDDILVKVDRMSMANSLETRAPLLDYEVAEFAASIPARLQMKDGNGKYILRQLAKKILPKESLNKKKQGFAVPVREWFQNELNSYLTENLVSDRFRTRPYFDHNQVEKIIIDHTRGHRDYSVWLWSLLNFELWYQAYIDKDSRII